MRARGRFMEAPEYSAASQPAPLLFEETYMCNVCDEEGISYSNRRQDLLYKAAALQSKKARAASSLEVLRFSTELRRVSHGLLSLQRERERR